MKYYIIKMSHNHFKCQSEDNINTLINNFIKKQNKGESKSDRIYLENIKSISKTEFEQSILFDESYKLTI